MLTKIKYCFFVAILFSLLVCGSARSEESLINSPYLLIQKFYEDLLSNKPAKDCAEIFIESRMLKLKNVEDILGGNSKVKYSSVNEALWIYLRENKKLFLFDSIEPSIEIPSRAGKLYCFGRQLTNELITDGNLSIILIAKISKEDNRIYKEVSFGVERYDNTYDKGYLINLFGTTINGIFIFPNEAIKDKENLVEKLGFSGK